MPGTIRELSTLHCSSVVSSTVHNLSIVNIVLKVYVESEKNFTRECFSKDWCFGAMKMRNEGSQDIAPFNPVLVFAADCLISSACFYSDRCSKSLT